MSPWQMVRQLRAILAEATWSTAPSDTIVGDSCYITAGIEDESKLPSRVPFCLLNIGTARSDTETPDLLDQEFIVVVAVSADLHGMGESHLIGSGSGQTPRSAYSAGRGLLEVHHALMSHVDALTGADGTPMVVVSSTAAVVTKSKSRNLAWMQTTLRAVCTRYDTYPAPRNLVLTGSTLTWDLPPSRFDLSSIIARYASGSTAPADASSGTGITLASSLAVTATLPGSGTRSVALFARYVDTNAGDYKDSGQDVGSYREGIGA